MMEPKLNKQYQAVFAKVVSHLNEMNLTDAERKLFREFAPNIPELNEFLFWKRTGSRFAKGSAGFIIRFGTVVGAGILLWNFFTGGGK